MNVIKVDDLVKRYGEFTAVDHFNLVLNEGEILGLLGPNGSGKSTTINCILSLLNYEFGSIEIFGEAMHPAAYNIKKNIGIVPQDVAVFTELTVFENIDYFCSLYIDDKEVKKTYVEEAISFVGLEVFTSIICIALLLFLNVEKGIGDRQKEILKRKEAIFDEHSETVH